VAVAPGVIVGLPAYNEAARLPDVLRGVAALAPAAEIVVVDDGSADGTGDVAAQHGATVLRHPFNLGYGAALQTLYKYALRSGAELVVQLDADGQHDPAEIARVAAPVAAGECDLAIGSRFVAESDYRMGPIRGLGRLLFAALGRVAGVTVSDPTSGFQALNRRVVALYCEPFFPPDYPDVDVLVAATRRGIRILEVPVEMRASSRGSKLHGGTRDFYYVYKMLLSLWTESRR
jgi:glycosyltransferase involved in cell wall biosynthesis